MKKFFAIVVSILFFPGASYAQYVNSFDQYGMKTGSYYINGDITTQYNQYGQKTGSYQTNGNITNSYDQSGIKTGSFMKNGDITTEYDKYGQIKLFISQLIYPFVEYSSLTISLLIILKI